MNEDPAHTVASITPELRALLESQPWKDICPRLTKYALYKTRWYYWQGRYGGDLPGGHHAEDLAEQAITKLFVGEREWDPRKQPDLYKHLQGVVDSLISHLLESRENERDKKVIRLVTRHEAEENEAVFEIYEEPALRPDGQFLVREFRASLADAPQLQILLDCVYNHPTIRSATIAKQMGITNEAVHNLKRQLQRRLTKYLALVPRTGNTRKRISRK